MWAATVQVSLLGRNQGRYFALMIRGKNVLETSKCIPLWTSTLIRYHKLSVKLGNQLQPPQEWVLFISMNNIDLA